MVVSPEERTTLYHRVAARLPASVSRELVRSAVDRVVGQLATTDAPSADPAVLTVVTKESAPDLASRIKGAIAAEVVGACDFASAIGGRHAVVVVRSGPQHADAIRRAASAIGAQCVERPVSA